MSNLWQLVFIIMQISVVKYYIWLENTNKYCEV